MGAAWRVVRFPHRYGDPHGSVHEALQFRRLAHDQGLVPFAKNKEPRFMARFKLREMSVSRVLYLTIICLGLKLPVGSSDACERDGPPHNAQLILHQVGFTERTSRQAAGELLPRLSTLTV